MAERAEKFVYRMVRIPEGKEGTLERSSKRMGGQVLFDPMEGASADELAKQKSEIYTLMGIITRHPTPDGVFLDISSQKLEARQAQIEALTAGKLDQATVATKQYYALERMLLTYSSLISSPPELENSSS